MSDTPEERLDHVDELIEEAKDLADEPARSDDAVSETFAGGEQRYVDTGSIGRENEDQTAAPG